MPTFFPTWIILFVLWCSRLIDVEAKSSSNFFFRKARLSLNLEF